MCCVAYSCRWSRSTAVVPALFYCQLWLRPLTHKRLVPVLLRAICFAWSYHTLLPSRPTNSAPQASLDGGRREAGTGRGGALHRDIREGGLQRQGAVQKARDGAAWVGGCRRPRQRPLGGCAL